MAPPQFGGAFPPPQSRAQARLLMGPTLPLCALHQHWREREGEEREGERACLDAESMLSGAGSLRSHGHVHHFHPPLTRAEMAVPLLSSHPPVFLLFSSRLGSRFSVPRVSRRGGALDHPGLRSDLPRALEPRARAGPEPAHPPARPPARPPLIPALPSPGAVKDRRGDRRNPPRY